MQLTIIIVNYNVKHFLALCLASVQKACSTIQAQIIVVDNNSTDGSKSYLENIFNGVQFFWLTENVGFSKANNYALKYATGENILFLNPDTIVPENCFINCLSFIEAHKNFGALGVRMINNKGIFLKESKRGYPSLTASLYKAIGLANLIPKKIGGYYANNLPELENNKVPVLAGAFMMLSKAAINATKGFDEDFFMYGEDIDVSFRIKKAGLENYYVGTQTIIHFKGESTSTKNKFYYNNFYGAMKLFVQKHYNYNLIMRYFIYTGITLKKQLAILKNSVTIKPSNLYQKRICFLGLKEDIIFCQNQISNLAFFIQQENEADLKKLIVSKEVNLVIFSNNLISNANAIAIIDSLKLNCTYAFYDSTQKILVGHN
jgi:GT2 family glycosyltransferase